MKTVIGLQGSLVYIRTFGVSKPVKVSPIFQGFDFDFSTHHSKQPLFLFGIPTYPVHTTGYHNKKHSSIWQKRPNLNQQSYRIFTSLPCSPDLGEDDRKGTVSRRCFDTLLCVDAGREIGPPLGLANMTLLQNLSSSSSHHCP
jgi:hypothetical protein